MARIALERAARAVIDPANAKNTNEVRALRLPGSQVTTERLAEYLCCENLGDVVFGDERANKR